MRETQSNWSKQKSLKTEPSCYPSSSSGSKRTSTLLFRDQKQKIKPIQLCASGDPLLREESDVNALIQHFNQLPLSIYANYLNEEQVNSIARCCRLIVLPPNRVFVPKGGILNRFYVIIDGNLNGYLDESQDKMDNLVKIFRPGDTLGTQGLVYSQGISWHLQSSQVGCMMLFLERQDFLRILRFHEATKIEKSLHIMKRVEVFRKLREEQLIQLIFAGNVQIAQLGKKQVLKAEESFVVLEGKAKVRRGQNEDTGETLKEADYFCNIEKLQRLIKLDSENVCSVEIFGIIPAKLLWLSNEIIAQLFASSDSQKQLQKPKQQLEPQNIENNLEKKTAFSCSPEKGKILTEGKRGKKYSFSSQYSADECVCSKQEAKKLQGNYENGIPQIERQQNCHCQRYANIRRIIFPKTQILEGQSSQISPDELNTACRLNTQETFTEEVFFPQFNLHKEDFIEIPQIQQQQQPTAPTVDLQSQYQMRFLLEQQKKFQKLPTTQSTQDSTDGELDSMQGLKATRQLTSSSLEKSNSREKFTVKFSRDNLFPQQKKQSSRNSVYSSSSLSLHVDENLQQQETEPAPKGLEEMSFHEISLKPMLQKYLNSAEYYPHQKQKKINLAPINLKQPAQDMTYQLNQQIGYTEQSNSKELYITQKSSRESISTRGKQGEVTLDPNIRDNQQCLQTERNIPATAYPKTPLNSSIQIHTARSSYSSNSMHDTGSTKMLAAKQMNSTRQATFIQNKILGNFQCMRQPKTKQSSRFLKEESSAFLPNVDFFKFLPEKRRQNSQPDITNHQTISRGTKESEGNDKHNNHQRSTSVSSAKSAIANYFSVGFPFGRKQHHQRQNSEDNQEKAQGTTPLVEGLIGFNRLKGSIQNEFNDPGLLLPFKSSININSSKISKFSPSCNKL